MSAALLAQAPPPGFAADLFSGIHIRATIFVTAPGTGGFGIGRAGDCASFTDESPRKGWSNFGVYTFSKHKSGGSFLVVSGVDPIYATRSESTHHRGDSCGNMVYLGEEERRRLLAEVLNIRPQSIGWNTEVHMAIEFKSEEQFYNDLQKLIAAQQEKYRVTATALFASNLITAAEQPESVPQLDLYLEDQRGPDYSPITAPP